MFFCVLFFFVIFVGCDWRAKQKGAWVHSLKFMAYNHILRRIVFVFVQLGVSVWSDKHCEGKFNAFLRLNSYSDWIKKTVTVGEPLKIFTFDDLPQLMNDDETHLVNPDKLLEISSFTGEQ